ncbi:MAG: BatA domain-containing protein [Thermoguttaceae bacterium]|jgi:hypothetical protein
MTLIPAIAVGGLLLALGPVVIHILFRWRYQVVEFAAFRFLLESRRRSRHRLRWEELLLILLRVLACVLVGLMLADVRTSGVSVGRSAPRAHLFVLDDSLSMGQQAGGTTLYQKACAHLVRRLEGMAEGDLVAVISASRPRSDGFWGRLEGAAEANRGNLAARISASKPTGLRADFPAAIRLAAELVASQEAMPVRLHLLSDFRKPDFAGPESAASLQSALAALDSRDAEIALLDFGVPCRNNLAVERVALGRNVPVAGVSTPLRVTIRNTGQEASVATQLEAAVGEMKLPVQPVPALAPGETAEVELSCTFDAPGSTAVRVTLPPDDLPADSDCWLAFEVRDALRILVLDGSPNPGDEESASYALAHALDPSGRGTFGRRVDVQSAATWNPASLAAYDLVVLTNVREFPASRDESGQTIYPGLRAIEEYVRAGGGLAIFAGDNISTAFYNGPFYADGRGLSPLPLADRPLPTADGEKFVRLAAESVRDIPMLRLFSSRGPNFSQFVRFHAVVPALIEPGEAARATAGSQILASFDNGLPAVCRRSYGKGSVIMWYSSADTKWTNWPKDLSFLPVMNDMAWELARVAENDLDDLAGRTIGYTLPVRLSGAVSAVLKTPAYPAEDIEVLALQDDGRQRSVVCPQPAHAGLYELTLALTDRTQQRVLFSRRPDPKESDLTLMTEGDLRTVVGRPCTYVPNLAAEGQAAEASTPLSALWWVFLAVLLAILAVESFLGLRFGHYVRRMPSALELSR